MQKQTIVLNWLEKFKKYLLIAVVVTIPSNLFFKLGLKSAYVNGLLVDYLIPKIHLLDCFLLLFFIVYLIDFLIKKKYKKLKIKFKKIDLAILLLSAVFILRNIGNPLIVYQLSSAIIFFLIIKHDQTLSVTLSKSVLLSLAIQSFFAYYQFKNQENLAPYHYFGESNLHSFAGISKANFINQEKILPYGTTAHPNILAGVILIFSILVTQLGPLKKDQRTLVLVNCLIIILITQSVSALVALSMFFTYLILTEEKKTSEHWLKKSLLLLGSSIFLLTPILLKKINIESLSIQRRVVLNNAAIEMFQSQPILGVGLNQFTRHLEKFTTNKEIIKFIQPVHHLGLLLISEGGILLLSIFILLILKESQNKKLKRRNFWLKLAILLPIAALDHYLVTQSSGLFALMLYLYYASENARN